MISAGFGPRIFCFLGLSNLMMLLVHCRPSFVRHLSNQYSWSPSIYTNTAPSHLNRFTNSLSICSSVRSLRLMIFSTRKIYCLGNRPSLSLQFLKPVPLNCQAQKQVLDQKWYKMPVSCKIAAGIFSPNLFFPLYPMRFSRRFELKVVGYHGQDIAYTFAGTY